MLEIEIKAKISGREELRKKLLALGAKREGSETQEDIYFAHPERDFAKTDEALRLRRSGGEFFLTYKGPKIDNVTKTREEHEVKILSPESAKEILLRLGFREALKLKKRREHYSLGEYSIALDSVEGLGEFVEVEKRANSYSPDELIEFLKKLGIGKESVERKSYLELLLEKRRE